MASEIRVDKINSLSGVGTVTLSPTGVDIAGITTVATFKVGTGITASSDGDIFATGVCTATKFVGANAEVSGDLSGATGTFTGNVSIADKIIHTGDTNTAIRFPAADTVSVETAGSERFRFASDGVTHVNSPDSASGGRIWGNSSALYLQSGNGRQTIKVSDASAGVNRTIEMTSDGNLKISNAGNGIDFSSTDDASGMSNELLDDYEEGDYLPSFTVGSGSITLANTHKTLCYTKIGRQVTIIGQLKIDSVSSPSGILRAALPFNRGNQTEQAERTMGNIMVTGAAVNNANEFTTYPDGGSDHFLEIISISGTSINRNGGDNMQAGAYIYVNYTYFAA